VTLLLLILIPMIFGVTMPLIPRERVKAWAMAGTLLPVAWYAFSAWSFTWSQGHVDALVWQYEWVPSLGLQISLAADTVSMLLIGLTVLLGPIVVFGSFSAVTERVRSYYAWLLVLQGAMTGVFAARDLVLFYVFFEFTLIPMFVLISLYGSTNRKKAAIKFFLYTFTGSIIALAGLVFVAWFNYAKVNPGTFTFDFGALRTAANAMPASTQAWVFAALMLGFAVKVPLFPVHTWLPLAHTEAPTAGSVVLAGVLLKLGTYGIYRFVLEMTPLAAAHFAPAVAVLAIIGILYAGLICWVQGDVKKLVAYSSVSHLGFCVLGMFSFTSIGLTGAVLYMINHGLSTGALFLLIGMMYERYHTRQLKELGGLAAKMPMWATFMVFFAMASVGLPGLNGFVSEFMCILGTFQSPHLGPWYAAVAGTGMIVGAIYMLYMLGRIVWGPLVEPAGHGHDHASSHPAHPSEAHDDRHGALPADLTGREIAVLAPLAAACIFLGVYPTPALRALGESTRDLASHIQRAGERSLKLPASGRTAEENDLMRQSQQEGDRARRGAGQRGGGGSGGEGGGGGGGSGGGSGGGGQ
jgi:NADH-quinone oxidoreductase subunit M